MSLKAIDCSFNKLANQTSILGDDTSNTVGIDLRC